MTQKTVSIVVDVAGADDATRKVRQMRTALDDFAGSGSAGFSQIMKQSREASDAMKELQRNFQMRDQQKQMIAGLDDFFGRILSGARSTGDIFKNIWKEVSNYFETVLKQMASSWSMNLGGILPLLGGGGAKRSPTTGEMLGLPATMPAGDIFSGQGFGSLIGTAGIAIANLTIGSNHRGLSVIGGALGGGMAGIGIGSALSGMSGTLGLLGSFGGPIGAVVGGLIGLFTGGGGKKKEHDAAIANQGFAQLREILEDYNRFRRDYASSVDAANRVWSQMQGQWVRSQSAPSQRPYFEAILRSMQQTEDERNRRRQVMSSSPLPEFASGGYVAGYGTGSSNGVLAVVHPGEFVIKRQTVDRLGVTALDGLNRGSATNAGGMQISLEPASAQTLGEMLRQNPQALEEGLLVVMKRGGAASRMLRQ